MTSKGKNKESWKKPSNKSSSGIKNIKNYTRESTRSLRTKDKYNANMISKPKKTFNLSHREKCEFNEKAEEEEKEKMVGLV